MKTVFPIILGTICLFYACQEPIDFSAFEDKNAIVLNKPIRFDQLVVGQNSTYVSIQQKHCGNDLCCEPNSDTLKVEIIARDTNGYLVKETTNIDTTAFYFYLDYYTGFESIEDTIGKEPNIEEQPIRAIITKSINGGYSKLYRRLGAKFYLNTYPDVPLEKDINDLCYFFDLPIRENDPLPGTDHIFIQHSLLHYTKGYSFEGNNYGNLLLGAHDYGHRADARAYNYGYTLEQGLVFSGFYRVTIYSQVWHLIPDN